GDFLSDRISSTADMIAAAGLAIYGLFVIVRALVSPEHADPNLQITKHELPLPLSVDNVAAGASLGLASYSPWLTPVLFAMITFTMSVAEHQLGRTATQFIPHLRTDLLTDMAFIAMTALVATG